MWESFRLKILTCFSKRQKKKTTELNSIFFTPKPPLKFLQALSKCRHQAGLHLD